MIRLQRTVTVDRSVEDVSHYLSDFRTTAQWDPHTATCTREDMGALRIDSRFVNTQKFGPMRPKFAYEVTELEPGAHVALHCHTPSAELNDRMDFVGDDSQTTVTYTAQITLKGVARLAEPLVKHMMKSAADDAATGMARALERLPVR